MTNRPLLKFSEGGNAKLSKLITTFSLPAGHSCPGARECLSKADPDTGKIKDGIHNKFRCFAASAESVFTNVRNQRWHNFDLLLEAGGADGMSQLILDSLPKELYAVRIHVSGDFFSQAYFDAWLQVAAARPKVEFYAYTKSLKFWHARKDKIPKNLRLVASAGGKFDAMIESEDLPNAQVVFHPDEAEMLGLKVDHDDSQARDHSVQKFALLIHGQQAAGSDASEALKRLREEGVQYAYSSK